MLIRYFLPAPAVSLLAGLLLWASTSSSQSPAADVNTNIGDVFSIACRVKAAPGNACTQTVLARGSDSTAPAYYALKLDGTTGHLQFYAPGLHGDMNSGISVDDNSWHQVAVTYAQGRMKFYKDGNLVKTSSVKGRIADAASSLSFNGDVSDVKVIKTVLNGIRIADLYTDKLAGWDLNEGIGMATYQDFGNPLYGKLDGPANTYDNYGAANTGKLKNTTWKKDERFSHVPDFSSPDAGVHIDSTGNIDLRNGFTIACWMKVLSIHETPAVILAGGADETIMSYFDLRLNTKAGELRFSSPALAGNTSARIKVDKEWQHIAVTYEPGEMRFYVDGRLIKTNAVTGTIAGVSSLTIGSQKSGKFNFNGNLTRLRIFGSALKKGQVADLYHETVTAGWQLDEGSGNIVHNINGDGSNGIVQNARWVAGNGSSFSRVMNFSAPGARVTVNDHNIHPGNRFTIAAWLQATAQRKENRTILASGKTGTKGAFSFALEQGTGNLVFTCNGLTGDMNSGFTVDDNIWHHVMITYADGEMKFYKDRQLVKTSRVTGTITRSNGPLTIGGNRDGAGTFNGNLADVKIYQSPRVPEDVTRVVPPAGPALILKKGIVFDRIQSRGFPVQEEWQISPNDVAVAKAAGFDHIKILLTADEFIRGAGVNMANMSFVDKVVNMVLASGLPCVVDLHPEGKFKTRYLGTDTGFTDMLGFYKAFSKYLADRWTPQQVAFQLMTEPFANKDGDWNRLNTAMVAAVRSEMPDHTLIVSGDRAGNIYAMTAMIPANDNNIYYSFTTYEPYRFGFNTQFDAWRGTGGIWKDISFMPWPSSPEIVADRMKDMLSTVKEENRAKAEADLVEYGKGHFNSQWLRMRARNVRDWNDSYGGNLHVLVAEFGCIDHKQAGKQGASLGPYPEERVRFVRELRQSFEEVGIGWEYWSFNEYFTILNPDVRKPYGEATVEILDKKMLSALGL